ncbi:glycosyltransferase [Haloferax sp. MBLA0076]|uniref:Glycosyltransferase n=1 Tax=Haloferax litoreum TaxID=2666140 RepID=A0A6A8GEE2_9EURY|nr:MULTISPECIES: glycosyltransferase family 2 protein [Haloferax]KAB1193265.1 glycosyltransferase family 2 protein [Haloferax sp. CBA1148]MRX21764.1 glycosyltransferase [Haloferax litoreum]
MNDTTVIIPAFNEAGRIGQVVAEIPEEYDVLVIDDGSTDATATEARDSGAEVVEQERNRGYIEALKRGFREATTDIVVTYDADGEHRPEQLSRLVSPIREGEFDLVLGARREIPRPSERFLNRLTQLKADVTDSGTGLRALRRDLAVQLRLDTACTCGTFVLEAASHGARIGEVPIRTRSVDKPRGIAWEHITQTCHLFRHIIDK